MRAALWSIATLFILCVAGAAFWLMQAKSSASAPIERAHLEIAGEKFDFDRRYLTPPRDDGVVELAAFLPDFKPAAATDDISSHTDIDERFERTVYVELRPADEKLDPAERTERLYLRFLSETAWSHPGGLVARAFESGSPFEGDELFFVAPDGREFAARCHRSDPSRNLPNTCIAAFRSGAVDAQIRFSASRLSDWETLMKGARGLIDAARQ